MGRRLRPARRRRAARRPVPLPRRPHRRGVDDGARARPVEELYRRNGLQFLPFNTLYQLAADARLATADTLLLVPDLLAYWLTGTLGSPSAPTPPPQGCSTSGRASGTWTWPSELGLPPALLRAWSSRARTSAPLCAVADQRVGGRHDVVARRLARHGVGGRRRPDGRGDAAYISCGTWGLVGVELEKPVLTEAAREAGFTNEGGVDGRVRFLHNVMGLWLLNESLRFWEAAAGRIDLAELLAEAAASAARSPLFDADDRALAAPGDMPARIAALVERACRPVPRVPASSAIDRGEPRGRVRRRPWRRGVPARACGRVDPRRRRRRAERAAVPGDGRPLRAARRRRAGRGDRAG